MDLEMMMMNVPVVKMENRNRSGHSSTSASGSCWRRKSRSSGDQHKIQFSTSGESSRMLAISLFLILAYMTPGAFSEYENTWNFYYEQPCCGGSSSSSHNAAASGSSINGQVPHRFHKGTYTILWLYK